MTIRSSLILGASLLSLTCGVALADSETQYQVISHIPAADGKWDHIAVDPTNNRALIAHGDQVTAFDLSTQKVTESFATGLQIHTAMPINDGSQILITNGGNDTVTIVDGKTGAQQATIPAGKKPDAATFDPSTKLVLVMDHSGGDITLIDPQRQKAVGTITIGGMLEEAAVDGNGLAYVNVEDKNETVVVDIKAAKVLKRYQLEDCESPTAIVFTPEEKQLVIACNGSAQVRDASDGKLIANFTIGGGADGIAYDASRHIAFVPSGATGTLAVIAVDTKEPHVIETVQTQSGARTIAMDSKTGKIYLPTAKFGPKPADGSRPPILPGSFEILVVGKN